MNCGYSRKISDPAFARSLKNNNRWTAIFSLILAVFAVVGFYIAGELGAEGMENPQALFYGLGIGGMFLIIALFTIVGRKRSKTWDSIIFCSACGTLCDISADSCFRCKCPLLK